MRHNKLNKRFGRNKAQRKALMNSLIRALFISYRIKTTVEKAKEATKLAGKLITHAKKAALSDIRAIDRILQDRTLTKKVMDKLSPLFKDKSSGYTRVIRSGFRKGDGAPMAILELTIMPAVEKKAKKAKPAAVKQEAQAQDKPAGEAVVPVKEKKAPKKAAPKPEIEKKPKETKPEKVEPKLEEKPKEGKPAAGKKGVFGKFRGFFKKKD